MEHFDIDDLEDDEVAPNGPTVTASSRMSSLKATAEYGNSKVVETMKAAAADKGDAKGDAKGYEAGAMGHLMLAAKEGQVDALQGLLLLGVDVNAVCPIGMSALMSACGNGQEQAAVLLTQHGANVNVQDASGATALMYTAHRGYTPIAKMLIKQGADLNAINFKGFTALRLALQSGHTDVVALLLENKADVNNADINGFTPLMHAAGVEDRYHMLEMLLDAGADINATSNDDQSALILAARMQRSESLRILVKRGAVGTGKFQVITPTNVDMPTIE